MTDTVDPRELLKNSLRELQELRRQVKAAEREKQERPVVIGAACRLPGADSLSSLARRGAASAGWLQEAIAFDDQFFHLGETASTLTPHLRLLLVTGWEALEEAGNPPAGLPADRVGVFIGIGGSERQRDGAPRIVPALQSAQTLATSFGFHGPVINVDAGDASALMSIDLACRSLLAGEIDFALAGGVALIEDTGDASVTAAGCGLVVLKRLSDAVAHRDRIMAVVHSQGANSSARDAAIASPVTERPNADAGHLNGLVTFLNALNAVQPDGTNETVVSVAVAAGGDGPAGLALQSAPPSRVADDPGPYLLLLSAQDGPALEASGARLAAHLREQPGTDLVGAAYTLRAGRTHFAHRRCLVAEGREQAIAALDKGDGVQAIAQTTGRPAVFLFPGLGSHYLNMARGLYDGEPVFHDVVDQCAQLLQPHLGLDIRLLIFAATSSTPQRANGAGQLNLRQMLRRQDGPADPAAARLDQTIHAQPALFVVEYALARLLESWGIRPSALIGYSLGEYVAACLAGVLSLEDALFLVATRARLIQALPPGKMIAVPLSETELAPLLSGGLAISAINGNSLCVVAGEPKQVETLTARLGQDGIAVQALSTTHAFHTAMLRPIAAPFKEALGSISLHPPAVPYISNLTGDWITAAQATSPEYWLEHSCRPVRFAAGIEALQRAGHDLIIEVGPSQALSSLVAAVARDTGDAKLRAVPAMRYDYDPQSDLAVLHKAIGELWLGGASIDWESFHPARRVSLPTYPFSVSTIGTQLECDTSPAPGAMPLASTPTESALAGIWRDLLKLPAIDRRRTFFDNGGNSLLATQLIFRIKKAFGVTLPLRAIFEAPSLAGMAQRIDGQAGEPTVTPSNGAAANDAPSAAAGLAISLPNGLTIVCQNQQEVSHFYDDIFVERVYVSHGIRLAAGAVVFDVGANIGLFSLFAHLEAPAAQLFSFEPAPPIFALLQANLQQHGVAATVYNCALSSTVGTAELTYYPKSTGMSSLYGNLDEEKAVLETVLRNQVRRGESELEPLLEHADDYLAERFKDERYTCRLRTLSDVIAEAGVERIDLLKIDVQKAELDVLLGLDDRDWPKVRQVVVEVHDADDRLARMRRMLEERGFHVETDQEALYAGSPIYLLYGTRD